MSMILQFEIVQVEQIKIIFYMIFENYSRHLSSYIQTAGCTAVRFHSCKHRGTEVFEFAQRSSRIIR